MKDSTLPWVVIGDLNELLSADEKHLFFKHFMETSRGIDLGFFGKSFTWENNQEGLACIKGRLDWAVANKDWLELFPLALVKHLRTEESDHCLIML